MTADSTAPASRRAPAAARQLVVFLHGYGADGNDLIDIGRAMAAPAARRRLRLAARARALRQRADGPAMVSRSPSAIRTSAGAASSRPRPALDAFLDAELARHGLPPATLALVGFSQGTMMALHVGLAPPCAPAAIVGYSGLLVAARGQGRRRHGREVTARRRSCSSMATRTR